MRPVPTTLQRVGAGGGVHPSIFGLPPTCCLADLALTFPSGTLLYPLKCRGPGTVGLELEERWGPRQETRQKGR